MSYGAFIVPGLIMLMILTQSVANGSFGIYFPKFLGTIYELLSAPVSSIEIVIGYVGAAASKSLILGVIVLLTAGFFVPIRIDHPVWMLFFLVAHGDRPSSLLGFIIGICGQGHGPAADRAAADHHAADLPRRHVLFDQRAAAVLAGGVAVQPDRLSDLGLPLELLSVSDVNIGISVAATLGFLAVELGIVAWIFRTGYRLKN